MECSHSVFDKQPFHFKMIDCKIIDIYDLYFEPGTEKPIQPIEVKVDGEKDIRRYVLKGTETIIYIFGTPTENKLSNLEYSNDNIPVAMKVPDIEPENPFLNIYHFDIANPSPNLENLENSLDTSTEISEKYGGMLDSDEEFYHEKEQQRIKKRTEQTQLAVSKLISQGITFKNQNKLYQAKKCFHKVLLKDPINETAYENLREIKYNSRVNYDFTQFLNIVTKYYDKILAENSPSKKYQKEKSRKKSIYSKKIHPLTLKPDLSNLNDVFEQGKQLVKQNQPIKAIKIFQTILYHDSTNIHPRNYLGYIFLKQKKYLKAVKNFLQTLKYDPTNSYALDRLIQLALIKKFDPQAATIYKIILKHDPTNINAIGYLADLLIHHGKHDEAERLYYWSLVKNPTNFHLWNNLGFLHHQQGNFIQAENHYQNALIHNPSFSYAINNLANLYYEQKEFPKAKEVYRTALIHSPSSERFWTKFGFLLTKMQSFPEAKYAFQQALKCDPMNINAWINLGQCLLELNEIKEAELLFQTVLKYHPTNVFFLNQLAYTLHLQGKLSEALQTYQKALKYEPNNPLTLYNLGTFLQLEGSSLEFQIIFRKALQQKLFKSPTDKKHISVISFIKQLWYNLEIALEKQRKNFKTKKGFKRTKGLFYQKISFTILYNLSLSNCLSNNEIGFSMTSIVPLAPPPTDLINSANSDYT